MKLKKITIVYSDFALYDVRQDKFNSQP